MGNGSPLVIAVDALTFFLCAAVLPLVHVPSPTRPDRGSSGRIEQSVWADMREGALYIWHRLPSLWLLSAFGVANFAGAPTGVVVPLLVSSTSRPIGLRVATPVTGRTVRDPTRSFRGVRFVVKQFNPYTSTPQLQTSSSVLR
jgi:hypothetical protein